MTVFISVMTSQGPPTPHQLALVEARSRDLSAERWRRKGGLLRPGGSARNPCKWVLIAGGGGSLHRGHSGVKGREAQMTPGRGREDRVLPVLLLGCPCFCLPTLEKGLCLGESPLPHVLPLKEGEEDVQGFLSILGMHQESDSPAKGNEQR